MRNPPELDRERLFQALFKKDWDYLAEQLHIYRTQVDRDPFLPQVTQLFEAEFMAHIQGLPAQDQLDRLRHISLVITDNRRRFKPSFWRPVMELKLRAMFELKHQAFPGVASEFMNELPLAQELLGLFQVQQPEMMADARRSGLKVTTVAAASVPDRPCARHVVSLFKSLQEQAFYEAMCRVLPSLLAYPNVSISTALAFKGLKDALESDAKEFFFRGVFDFVVFDPANGYLPVYFFELDSSYHNVPDAIRRDRLKDKICVAAGIKLLRLRAFESKEATPEAFAQLIRELIPASPHLERGPVYAAGAD